MRINTKKAPNLNSIINIDSVIYFHLSHTRRVPSKAVNLRACYRFYLLILPGDIAQNPGPTTKLKHLCGSTTCKQKTTTVAAYHRVVLCEACYQWFHINCANTSAAEYNKLKKSPDPWICADCPRFHFSDSFFSDNPINSDMNSSFGSNSITSVFEELEVKCAQKNIRTNLLWRI
ncbi:hypothetical protein DPMN_008851 [Dreissena polymorpha]|uniref:PHD-type domain-containing protein n=1 Tax=Dreissena polymorpha TaxID=45954 RepID=A0A9D4RZJ0_DREPO|nr:hypothetical protein DPMN_008851 [Dreissena polymorpha]